VNELELTALKQALSNEARVLYCLYLRPHLNPKSHTVTINNKSIMSLLNAQQNTITLGREISALFKELYHAGLIDIDGEHSFQKSLNKQTVRLCLSSVNVDLEEASLHQQHHKMSVSWRPQEVLFNQVCQLVGVIELDYNADEMGEFIAYWLGRPEIQQSQYQWIQKFVLHLKQRRIRQPSTLSHAAQSKVGHQWVTPRAGIEFDDNVKKLISKYSESS
jgi:hypothetical protein